MIARETLTLVRHGTGFVVPHTQPAHTRPKRNGRRLLTARRPCAPKRNAPAAAQLTLPLR